jgi:hypothetical protein
MDRCMQVGSVAGGVLCADGHLGYAMPELIEGSKV